MTTVEPRPSQDVPGSYAIRTSAMCAIFGVTMRHARGMVDRLPAEYIDRIGRERVVPVWLARRHWPNTFRDWPEAPPQVEVVTL